MAQAHGGARPAHEAAAIDHRRAPFQQRLQQLDVVARVIFEVGVLNDNDVARGVFKAGAQGGALAAILLVKDNLQIGLRIGHPFTQNVTRAIGGAVVDDDNLAFNSNWPAEDRVVAGRVDRQIDGTDKTHDLFQCCPFVIDGHHD